MAAIVTAAVVSAVGIGYSAYQGSKARKEQRSANARAERLDRLRSQRERAEAFRENRVRAAVIEAQGAGANLQGSTAVQGTLAALGTNAAANLQFANAADTLNAQRMNFLNRADSYNARASYGDVLTSAGSVIRSLKPGA